MERKIIRKRVIQTFGMLLAKQSVIFMLLFSALVSLEASYGQAAKPDMKLLTPPYIAHTSNFMMILFHLKAEEAQKLLPANVKVKSDDKGMVTGGMEIYTTDQIYGVPNYTIGFIYVEVNGLESNDGSPGHWAVWGAMNNDTSLQNFRHFYNYPYKLENKIMIGKKGNESTATIGDSEGLKLKLRIKVGKPVSAGGIANNYSQSSDGRIIKTEIPWLANGNEADVISFEVSAGSNKVLETIKEAKPFFGLISNNAFSYSRPIME